MPSVIPQNPYNWYSANGVSTVFPYTFHVLRASDLIVLVDGVAAPSSDYTVSGIGTQAGGSVTFFSPPAAGTLNVLIYRSVALARSIEYVTNGDLRAGNLNLDLNLLWHALQNMTSQFGGEIRAPYPEQLDLLPGKTERYDGMLAFADAAGQGQPVLAPFTVTQVVSTIAAAYSGAAGPLDALSFVHSGAGAVSRTAQDKARDFASVRDYGAVGDGVADDTAAIQAAVDEHQCVYFPAGTYRTIATIDLSDGAVLVGAGRQTVIEADGVDCFSIAQSLNGIVVRDMTIRSFGDPRLYQGIAANGVNGGTINNLFHSNLYMQGWAVAVYWSFVWSSTMDCVYTVNCNNGLRHFGQSANNSVSNCRLTVNGGNASIDLVPDGALVGEGLVVTNSALTSGAYGIKSGTGFFSLHVSNCIIDLISDTAIYGTDIRDMRLANNFMYAANYCVFLAALGVAVNTGTGIIGNKMRITGNGNAVHIANNNDGVAVLGNTITIAGVANGVYCNAAKACIGDQIVNNSGTGAAVYLDAGATGFQLGPIIDTGTTGTLVTGGTPFMQTQGIHVVTDTSGAALALTTNNPAYWNKAGNLCSMGFDITFPATPDATDVKLSLPFTGTNGGYAGAGMVGLTTYAGFVNIQVGSGGAFFRLSVGGTFLTNANMSGKRIAGQILFTTTT